MASFSAFYRIEDIPQQRWQALLAAAQPHHQRLYYPFLDHRFLLALEQSGCIDSGHHDPLSHTPSGWLTHILVSHDAAGEIDQVVPAFIKHHSYAEYVFDWSWAEAYQQHGLAYYPKLLLAAPFTPATGPRLLGSANPDWSAITQLLADYCQQHRLSGWHLNFIEACHFQALTQQREDAGTPEPLVHAAGRSACQFHWYNRGYQSFDHYLEYFSSRKRKSVRKERQKIAQQGLTLVRKTAADIQPGDIDVFYHCYQMTYAVRRSRGYLNREFFHQLLASMPEQLMLVMAYADDDAQHACACALYLFDDSTLYGRYWGALREFDALHFEACYYQGIEFCIEQNLQRFDPGTQGEHKISRGFEPTLTYSVHQLMHPDFQRAVHHFVQQEQSHILDYQQQARSLLPFKADQDES